MACERMVHFKGRGKISDIHGSYYQRPYDPLCPVVCIDETKKLIKETCIAEKNGFSIS